MVLGGFRSFHVLVLTINFYYFTIFIIQLQVGAILNAKDPGPEFNTLLSRPSIS